LHGERDNSTMEFGKICHRNMLALITGQDFWI